MTGVFFFLLDCLNVWNYFFFYLKKTKEKENGRNYGEKWVLELFFIIVFFLSFLTFFFYIFHLMEHEIN